MASHIINKHVFVLVELHVVCGVCEGAKIYVCVCFYMFLCTTKHITAVRKKEPRHLVQLSCSSVLFFSLPDGDQL